MDKHILKIRAVDKDIFVAIRDGVKTIETRAATPKYQNVKVGDELEIRCAKEKLVKVVKAIQHYDSVESIYHSADFSQVMPGVTTLDGAKQVLYAFPRNQAKIARYGLLAFYL